MHCSKHWSSGCSRNSFGYFNSIKKDTGRNEGYTSEIKKSLQGTNSGEDEAENQINDLEHKEGKSIQSEQQEEKIIF